MLGCDCGGRPIEASKDYASVDLSGTHVVDFGRAVNDVVDGLESEVNGHELYDGGEAHKRGSTRQPCKSAFSDGGVPESLGAVLVDESLRDLVGSVVVGDLFSNDEDVGISV